MSPDTPCQNGQSKAPDHGNLTRTTELEQQEVRDDLIQQTNSSSIVSKRSVEKLYYAGQPAYFRHFVSKFKRRSPLINRGYWLRMRAIEYTVESFLKETINGRKVVINLGCGYDPLPWLHLGKQQHLCRDVKFLDVDYPALMHKKVEIIKRTPELTDLLPQISFTSAEKGMLCDSPQYAAIGCDLRDLVDLHDLLQSQGITEDPVATLFIAEVSIAYMEFSGSQAVIEFVRRYTNARFCVLEQHLPDGRDHPFAQTMLNHFDKIQTPLHAIGTMAEMKKRFVQAGWSETSVDIRSLWHLWSDSTFLTGEQKRALNDVEPFDEWEEFALFCSHYFLLVARSVGSTKQHGSEAYSHDLPLGLEIVCKEIETAPCQRRFAALLSGVVDRNGDRDLTAKHSAALGIVAGLGKQERLTGTATYAAGDEECNIIGPALCQGLMCHTITEINERATLVVGGRSSPDKASAECWLRSYGTWQKVTSLPEGRYRHCAVPYCDTNGLEGVLIFGGRSSTGRLFSDFLLWSEQNGWKTLQSSVSIKARFGATMVRTSSHAMEGLLLGGMDDDCNICQDVWDWHWNERTQMIQLVVHGKDQAIQDQLLPYSSICRFGAQTFLWTVNGPQEHGSESILAGGIGLNGLIPRDFEFHNLMSGLAHRVRGQRPLLIGMSIDPQYAICFGGGATCFSFGTYWNKSAIAFHRVGDNQGAPVWHLRLEQKSVSPRADTKLSKDEEPILHPITKTQVQVISTFSSSEQFQELLKDDKPAILRGCNIGPCTSVWTPDYLKTALGGRQVVVHSSSTPQMDFQMKNFRYEVRKFDDFIDSVLAGELLYMRALSSQAPAEKPTDLALDFPQIAQDFVLPPELEYVNENAHSRPLRIAGRTIMWLHYDVMANVLCQIRGGKRLMLYPPWDIPYLELEAGMSSSSLDVFSSDAHSSLKRCHPYEAQLQPGDILYIPALWLHAAAPTQGLSVAVNVFFRHLKDGYAAGKDVYGNRDLAAYERGRQDITKVVGLLAALPSDARTHHLHQLSDELASQDGKCSAHECSTEEERTARQKSRKVVARIRKSFAKLPQKERDFYLTRLVLELEQQAQA